MGIVLSPIDGPIRKINYVYFISLGPPMGDIAIFISFKSSP
jgi:hypothetical protein